jgi:hypothetical protein
MNEFCKTMVEVTKRVQGASTLTLSLRDAFGKLVDGMSQSNLDP